ERARSLAARGRHDEALAAITDAASRAEATDVVPVRAATEAAAGDVHAAAGRLDDAIRQWRGARDRWAAKGVTVGVDRADRRLAELTADQS
ncbi:MAG TPA: hypothetical protein VF235_00890, partial [Actinomycetota bacterium]